MTFDNYLVVAGAILVVGLSTTQSAVLRFVVGLSVAATAAWWLTTVVIAFVEAFVVTNWLGVSPVPSSGSIDALPAIADVASLGILGVAQGLILSRSLRVRVAAALWVLGLVAALAVTGLLLATGMLARIMSGQSELLAIATGNAILGLVWGGLTGAMLVALMHVPRRAEAAIEPERADLRI